MYGQALRHGKRKNSAQLIPRELDRYPKDIHADFRSCSISTLRRYIEHYKLDVRHNISTSEMASAVARHYASDLQVDEEDTIFSFVKCINEYDPTTKRARREQELQQQQQHYRRGAAARNNNAIIDEDEEEQVYCYCRGPSYGEMIGCDNEDCKIEWFHVECVGIKPGSLKGREWFCPDCRKLMEEEREMEAEERSRTKKRKK